MSLRYKGFTFTGTANTQKFDAGIESNQAEPKKLIGLMVHLSGYAANRVQIYLDNEMLADIYDYHFQTEADLGAANFPYTSNRLGKIDLEINIPVGQRVRACLQCGATTKTIYGCYIFDVPE